VPALPGFGNLLQIPFFLPDLVSPEKRKQRLAGLLSQPADAFLKLAPTKNPDDLDLKKTSPFGKRESFAFMSEGN